jgi:hypothetical protein
VSSGSISSQAAQAALQRQRDRQQGTSAVSGSSNRTGPSLSERLRERREARRLARLSDEKYQRRMERRQRLIQRLGLADLSYQQRRSALQTYRAQRRADRDMLATHPGDGD